MAGANLNKGSRRIVFGSGSRGGHHLLPEILEIGWGRFAAADSGHLRPHKHPGAFEICCIVSGEVEWATVDGVTVLHEGDVYLTQPDEVHWGRDAAMHPCELYWLILGTPGSGYEWPGMEPALARYLEDRLRSITAHRLRGTPKLNASLTEIFAEHARSPPTGEPAAVCEGNVRAALQTLLIELVRVDARQDAAQEATGALEQLPREVRCALEILHSNPHDAKVMRLVRGAIGADLKKLNRLFVEHLGITLAQYWLRERIRLARERLLDSQVSVAEVASELGFSSGQHFATTFRKVTGLTPTGYRRLGTHGGSSSMKPRW